eukprot:3669028-Pyramimonas_sp.AAC.1
MCIRDRQHCARYDAAMTTAITHLSSAITTISESHTEIRGTWSNYFRQARTAGFLDPFPALSSPPSGPNPPIPVERTATTSTAPTPLANPPTPV